MKNVTYRGPEDPRDRTTRYRIGEHLLPVGVEAAVPDDVAATLADTEGQRFDIEGIGRSVTSAAAKLAAEKDFDLDEIEGDGAIGVDDVRAAIEAKEASGDNPPA